MTLKAKVLICALSGAMVGFWLSEAASMLVIGSNGGSLPGIFRLVVYVAYWPSRLGGTEPFNYFQPHPDRQLLVNVAGWTAAAVFAGLLHHALVPRPRPGGSTPAEPKA